MLSADKARETAQSLVEKARAAGADSADAIYVGSESQGVQVRLGELEHVDRSEGEEVGLRVFVGHKSASVASSDFSPDALAELVNRGVAMAREAPEDPYAALLRPSCLRTGRSPMSSRRITVRKIQRLCANGHSQPRTLRWPSKASPIQVADRPARPRAR